MVTGECQPILISNFPALNVKNLINIFISVFIHRRMSDTCVAGNIGSELSYTEVGVFISSDGGNSWRQVCIAQQRKARSLLLFLLTLHFPGEWSTHAVLPLFADL